MAINQQLKDYIDQQARVGVSNDVIKTALLEAGWQENDINEAMEGLLSPASARAAKPIKSSDALPWLMNRKFIILVGICALVSAAASFGTAVKLWSEPRPVQLPRTAFSSVLAGKVVSVDSQTNSLRMRIENNALFPDMGPVSANGFFDQLVYLDEDSSIVSAFSLLEGGAVAGYHIGSESFAAIASGMPIQVVGTYKKANSYRYTANTVVLLPEFLKPAVQIIQ